MCAEKRASNVCVCVWIFFVWNTLAVVRGRNMRFYCYQTHQYFHPDGDRGLLGLPALRFFRTMRAGEAQDTASIGKEVFVVSSSSNYRFYSCSMSTGCRLHQYISALYQTKEMRQAINKQPHFCRIPFGFCHFNAMNVNFAEKWLINTPTG